MNYCRKFFKQSCEFWIHRKYNLQSILNHKTIDIGQFLSIIFLILFLITESSILCFFYALQCSLFVDLFIIVHEVHCHINVLVSNKFSLATSQRRQNMLDSR